MPQDDPVETLDDGNGEVESDAAAYARERQEFLDAVDAYNQILGEVASGMVSPSTYVMSYQAYRMADDASTGNVDLMTRNTWVRENHPELSAAADRVMDEEEDFRALDEPMAGHPQGNCSIVGYTADKFYEYVAMAEMIYKLATDEEFRNLVASQMSEYLSDNAVTNAIVGNAYVDTATDLRIANAILGFFGLGSDETEEVADEMMEEGVERLQISGQQLADFFQGIWDDWVSRYRECGLAYAVSTVAIDGVFVIGEAFVGAAALRGLKIVYAGIRNGLRTVDVFVPGNPTRVGTAGWSDDALRNKYGDPDANHSGGLRPDQNRDIPDQPADEVPPRPREEPETNGSQGDPDPDPETPSTSPTRIRTREELLPNDRVPSVRNGAFNEWWNDLSYDELEMLLNDDVPLQGRNSTISEVMGERIRQPKGLHEWLPVASQLDLKRLGFTMEDIRTDRPLTTETGGVNPVWRHGETGSPDAHREVREIFATSLSREDAIRRLNTWADYRLNGGRAALPGHLQRIPNGPH